MISFNPNFKEAVILRVLIMGPRKDLQPVKHIANYYSLSNTNNLRWKTTFYWRRPLMEDDLMEYDLWWRMISLKRRLKTPQGRFVHRSCTNTWLCVCVCVNVWMYVCMLCCVVLCFVVLCKEDWVALHDIAHCTWHRNISADVTNEILVKFYSIFGLGSFRYQTQILQLFV